MSEAVPEKATEPQNRQRHNDVKNGFPQAHLHHKCFQFPVRIRSIVLYIKKNAKQTNEHKVLNEQRQVYQVYVIVCAGNNTVVNYGKNADQTRPGKTDNKRL
jgi:hypothetical protein